jgi:glucosamine--fructose-6-phosphate aminotransferase (isomerizing)
LASKDEKELIMCGIIGISSNQVVSSDIIKSLSKLEYRGYDSAGLAVFSEGNIVERKTQGKLSNLIQRLNDDPIDGHVGIGHTRWATHGMPSEKNAHPHSSSVVSVVHNGIIENAEEIKKEITGYNFLSETDSEVITALLTQNLKNENDYFKAVSLTIQRLEGSYALAIMFKDLKDTIIGAKKGSPLVVGRGKKGSFIGSDTIALSSVASEVSYLEDGDIVILDNHNIQIFDQQEKSVSREYSNISVSDDDTSKGSFNHFMEKEIHEQPRAVGDTLRQFIDYDQSIISNPDLKIEWQKIRRIHLIACGTAYYSCLIAKYFFEQQAKIPTECDMASEFRYRDPIIDDTTLYIFVSQSGETADTLAALNYCKEKKANTASVVNVVNSSIARDSNYVIYTKAGPEIGVASTKAFTAQLITLLSLSIICGSSKNHISKRHNQMICKSMLSSPKIIEEAIQRSYSLKDTAKELIGSKGVMYLGRGTAFPLALEGALKFKEISYIHAEGYPAGEMKHGPLALIEEGLPVICIVPSGPLFHKTISNIQEVIARGGKILMITDDSSLQSESENIWKIFRLPDVDPILETLIYTIPIQMLAYYTAVELGNDVDQPRNLAKSVTVE